MASILGDGTGPGGPGPSRCLLLLQRSLAIQLIRGAPPHAANAGQRESPKEHPADEMWMYDKGYNLFQVSHVIFVYVDFCLRHWYLFAASSGKFSLTIHAFGLSENSIVRPFSSWIFARWRRKSLTEAKMLERRCDRAPSALRVLCFVPSSR